MATKQRVQYRTNLMFHSDDEIREVNSESPTDYHERQLESFLRPKKTRNKPNRRPKTKKENQLSTGPVVVPKKVKIKAPTVTLQKIVKERIEISKGYSISKHEFGLAKASIMKLKGKTLEIKASWGQFTIPIVDKLGDHEIVKILRARYDSSYVEEVSVKGSKTKLKRTVESLKSWLKAHLYEKGE